MTAQVFFTFLIIYLSQIVHWAFSKSNFVWVVLQNSNQLSQDHDADKEGTWAQCSIPSCGKWRFLQSDVDPQELPERWVCAMNESKALFTP